MEDTPEAIRLGQQACQDVAATAMARHSFLTAVHPPLPQGHPPTPPPRQLLGTLEDSHSSEATFGDAKTSSAEVTRDTRDEAPQCRGVDQAVSQPQRGNEDPSRDREAASQRDPSVQSVQLFGPSSPSNRHRCFF
jgi:hypothetical protein